MGAMSSAAPTTDTIPTLGVRRLDARAVLPRKGHADDLGWDLCALETVEIPAGQLGRIQTGIAFEFPAGVGGFVKDRSSWALRGLHTLAGVIDPGYRGELVVVVANLGPDTLRIKAGERCAQLVLIGLQPARLEERGELAASDRGSGGFGSTGR